MNKKNKRSFGTDGENIASNFLSKNNYKIIKRNFRAGKIGEIDIIAQEDEFLCFIEVKTRRNSLFGSPSEAVDKRKQANIIRLANIYISIYKIKNMNIRFDIIEIFFLSDDEYKINLIKNAF